ncbi:tetratricopeptide repeat protein [Alteromonas facilis]|uniref:tetratricopeptide repeat protein n=1 Tax=Alteromonas facilis TaxID=2048004 RepID=UPI000C286286|nr:tetratricopeptide repeat protein [Alteromonas facilis]
MVRRIALVWLCWSLWGCTSTPTPIQTDNVFELGIPDELRTLLSVPSQPNTLPPPDIQSIFALSPEQIAHFWDYYNDPIRAGVAEHRRLYNYIDNLYVGFSYLGKTFDAQTALSTHSGNCLSLAIVTTALANLAGLDVAYQEVNTAPVYRRFDNVMTLSTHVRTHLFEAISEEEESGKFIRGKIIIDYFPDRSNIRGNMIDEKAFLAMYFRNLASDEIIYGRYPQAYQLLTQALRVAPSDLETLNAMAVVLNKLGEPEKALALYRYGYSQSHSSLNLLSNYAELLRQQGNTEQAERISKNLLEADDSNPYRWLDLANERIQQGKHFIARSLLAKTLEKAPYLHEAYFALAKSYYQTQELVKADEALKQAATLAYRPETERLYLQKRAVLEAVEEDTPIM